MNLKKCLTFSTDWKVPVYMHEMNILNRATLTDSYLCILWKFLTFQLDLNLLISRAFCGIDL
uniref:Uncharacterized protein n=1 Tax=Glossina palpalis gambiensis TaxID=67801 RepID=A0A1B0BL88_9MUSC